MRDRGCWMTTSTHRTTRGKEGTKSCSNFGATCLYLVEHRTFWYGMLLPCTVSGPLDLYGTGRLDNGAMYTRYSGDARQNRTGGHDPVVLHAPYSTSIEDAVQYCTVHGGRALEKEKKRFCYRPSRWVSRGSWWDRDA